jgi:hypothetical protein
MTMPIRNKINVIAMATPPRRDEFIVLIPWLAAESLPARRVDRANITTIAPSPVKPNVISAKRAMTKYLVRVSLLGLLAGFLELSDTDLN